MRPPSCTRAKRIPCLVFDLASKVRPRAVCDDAMNDYTEDSFSYAEGVTTPRTSSSPKSRTASTILAQLSARMPLPMSS